MNLGTVVTWRQCEPDRLLQNEITSDESLMAFMNVSNQLSNDQSVGFHMVKLLCDLLLGSQRGRKFLEAFHGNLEPRGIFKTVGHRLIEESDKTFDL